VQETRSLTLAFEVSGMPPAQTEALSIFTAGHRQARRVRALLEAACQAAQDTGWTPLSGPVELEVVLRHPEEDHNSDAVTVLGGIAAVLQGNKRAARHGLAHLGPLADVALYVDDRQIRRISYREEPAETVSYQVRVSALPTAG